MGVRHHFEIRAFSAEGTADFVFGIACSRPRVFTIDKIKTRRILYGRFARHRSPPTATLPDSGGDRFAGRLASRPTVTALSPLRQAVLPLSEGRRARAWSLLRAAVHVRRQADHALDPGRPGRHRARTDGGVPAAGPSVPGADRGERAGVPSPPGRGCAGGGVRGRQKKKPASGSSPRRSRWNSSGS